MTDCLRFRNLVEVCVNDVVEVVVEGGHRYHGIVERVDENALLLYIPPAAGGGRVAVGAEALKAVRIVACGSKTVRAECR